MLGTVEGYNEETKVGYITGFDDLLYFFREREVKGNVSLKKNDVVKFDYIIESREEMPIAIQIEKRNKNE